MFENVISVNVSPKDTPKPHSSPSLLPPTPKLLELAFDKVLLGVAAALILFPFQNAQKIAEIAIAKEQAVIQQRFDFIAKSGVEAYDSTQSITTAMLKYPNALPEERSKLRTDILVASATLLSATGLASAFSEAEPAHQPDLRAKLQEIRTWIDSAAEHKLAKAEAFVADLQSLAFIHINQIATSVEN